MLLGALFGPILHPTRGATRRPPDLNDGMPVIEVGFRNATREDLRVHRDFRGRRLGKALLEQAVQRARAVGCHLIQLTTDKKRPEAVAFYEKLGFVASHEGMKMHL